MSKVNYKLNDIEFTIIDELKNKIELIDTYENEIKKTKEEFKELTSQLTIDNFTEMSYVDMKFIYNKIKYSLSDKSKISLNEVLEQKKIIEYPQLNRPTYYPEIETLNISDEDKLRLDKLARKNIKYVIYDDDRLKSGRYNGMTKEDLANLYSLGILEKWFDFTNSGNGSRCKGISETELNTIKTIWDLNKKDRENTISEEDKIKKAKLEEDYHWGCIELCDYDDDDFYYEIYDYETFEKYKENNEIKPYYKFSKQPDLTYENL